MDDTTPTRPTGNKQALGSYGERLAARHLTDGRGMVLLERNWRYAPGRDRPAAPRRRRAGGVRGQDPHHRRVRAAARGGRRGEGRAAAAGRRRVAGRSTPPRPAEVRVDLVAVHPAAQGALGGRARPGDRLMPVATAYTTWLQGVTGHLIEVQADVSSGMVGTTVVGPAPTPPSTRRASGAGWPSSTAASPGRPASGSRSCCRRPTWPSAAPTSTSPWRSPCWPPTARCSATSCRALFVGELTLCGRAAFGARRAADGAGGSHHGITPGLRPRAAGRGRPRWCRASRSSGCGRWPRSSPC